MPDLASSNSNVDSGHGGQVRDKDGDEIDGYDEGILYHGIFS